MHLGDEGRRVPARRRRRTPEVAEREILAAAADFLSEHPFRELTVDEVMRRTDLSRPSFYVYFRDRYQLVLQVAEHEAPELFAMPRERLRLVRVVELFAEHGPVLRALADAAADDPGVAAAYDELVDSFGDATARHIEGKLPELDAHETAKALVWMTERYLTVGFGHEPQPSRQVAADTLATIWTRVLSAGSAGGG